MRRRSLSAGRAAAPSGDAGTSDHHPQLPLPIDCAASPQISGGAPRAAASSAATSIAAARSDYAARTPGAEGSRPAVAISAAVVITPSIRNMFAPFIAPMGSALGLARVKNQHYGS
jgi:hypothetical protein